MPSAPPWYADIAALQKRYLDFVDKLVARGGELVAEAVPQLRQLAVASTDDAYAAGRVQMAVQHQLYELETKARQVYDQQVENPACAYDEDSSLFDDFRSACNERQERLATLVERWKTQLERAARPDYQAEYARIVQEFQATRGTYRCQQCGGPLPIDRIFFIDVYIACPQCQTQSRFAPPPAARSLDAIARPFAEQRHVAYIDADLAIDDQRAALWQRWHQARMAAYLGDMAAKAEALQLCQQTGTLLAQQDQNMRVYLAAIYGDMKTLVPDHAAHYQTLYDQALAHHVKEMADAARHLDHMVNETRRIQPD